MKSREYSDWFGEGDTAKDVEEAIVEHGQPTRLFVQNRGYMAALVYSDKVVIVGYDGNEYYHKFVCDQPEAIELAGASGEAGEGAGMTDSGAERAARMNRHAAMPSRPHRLPEREISPIGASIIDHSEMKRWEKQGYARQRENGLWLHYSAICTLLRGERARADAAERKLRDSYTELEQAHAAVIEAEEGRDVAVFNLTTAIEAGESLRSELRDMREAYFLPYFDNDVLGGLCAVCRHYGKSAEEMVHFENCKIGRLVSRKEDKA